MHTTFWLQSLKRRNHLEDLGVDGSNWVEWSGVGHLAEDRNRWWAFVNTEMDLGITYEAGNFYHLSIYYLFRTTLLL